MSSKNNVRLDEESLDTIYLIYKDQLYRFIYRYSNDPQFSVDIVQDTFEKLIKKKYQYTPEKGNFKTYFFQIAYYTMVTKLKRRQKFKSLLPFLASDLTPTIPLEEKITVQKAIQSLPEEQRAVVLLTYYHDLTQRETAKILDIPAGTVKSRLHHAMKKLRADLGVDDDE